MNDAHNDTSALCITQYEVSFFFYNNVTARRSVNKSQLDDKKGKQKRCTDPEPDIEIDVVIMNQESQPNEIPRDEINPLKFCPYNASLKNDYYNGCITCSQEYHLPCANGNLEGLTSSAIKKSTKWQCEMCFIPNFKTVNNLSEITQFIKNI